MSQQEKDSSRVMLYSLAAAFTLSHLDRQILNITLNDIGVEFDLSDLQLGSLSGIAFAFVYVLFGFPVARITRRGNRKTILVAALSLWSAMTALIGMAGSFATVFLARVGVGIGEAGCVPPSHSMIVDAYPPEKRASALSFYSAGTNIGAFFAFLMGGILASQYGWRVAFFAAGAPGLLLALWMVFALKDPTFQAVPEEPAHAQTNSKTLIRQLIADTSSCHALIGAALTAMIGFGALAWVSVYLIRNHGMSTAQAGTYLAFAIGVAGALGTWLGGVFSDWLGKKDPTWRFKFVALTILLAKPFSVVFYLLDNTTLALIVFIIPAVTGSMFAGPTFSHLYSRVEASDRPMVTALFMFMVNLIGLGAGPVLVGWMSDSLSLSHGIDALRWALIILQIVGLWAALHFWLAGCAVKSDQVVS